HMHTVRMTLEHAATAGDHNAAFIQNPELQPHMRMSDCSQVSDGAAALLLVSEEGLRRIGRLRGDAVEIRSYGFGRDPLGRVADVLRRATAAAAAAEALGDAGLGPNDVQVAEVHDCFTIAELMMYEAAGWAAAGHGKELLLSGRTSLDGDLPVNTGGG